MKSITEDHGSEDRACVMLYLNRIQEAELQRDFFTFHEDAHANGDLIEAEKEPHITLIYGLLDDDPTTVRERLNTNVLEFSSFLRPLRIRNLSLFENEEFDVLKFDIVKSTWLQKLHDNMKTLTNDYAYDEYNPHMTIAYLRPGSGRNYLDGLGHFASKLMSWHEKTLYINRILHTGFKDVNGNRITTTLF